MTTAYTEYPNGNGILDVVWMPSAFVMETSNLVVKC